MEINRREFIQQAGFAALQLGLITLVSPNALAYPIKTGQLARSFPEAEGVASAGILDFVNAVEKAKLNVHSLMVLRHGKVLAEGWWAPYAPDLKHTLYSLSKSFTSSAIGLAVGEGKIKVTDKVISFFPESAPATISENLGKMRIQDLLTMSTGHDKDSTPSLRGTGKPNWVKSFLELPVEHEPGTFFVYNSGATYMLSAIIQKVTGVTLLEYLTPRLFTPLNITGMDWEVDPNGINTGGWGLRVKTEDIAKFGQMYLQKGVWNGKRILSEAWINDATSKHIMSKGGSKPAEENDWQQGYGYQFWRCRHNSYRGDGAYGQYCIVIPEQDMVIAMTSETGDMGAILNEVWNHILPAAEKNVVSKDASLSTGLKTKLKSLALPLPEGQRSSDMASKVNARNYKIDQNTIGITDVALAFDKDLYSFTFKDEKGSHTIKGKIGQWYENRSDVSAIPIKLVSTPVPGETLTKIAACGAWEGNSFQMVWRFIETAHYEIITCNFENPGEVKVAFKRSIAILTNAADPRPELIGKVIA